MLCTCLQVSYASPSTKLSKYPYLFRTIPTFDGIFDAIAQLLYEFEWKQILLITEEINLNTQVYVSVKAFLYTAWLQYRFHSLR